MVFLFTVISFLFKSFFLLIRWINFVFSVAKLDPVFLAYISMRGMSFFGVF